MTAHRLAAVLATWFGCGYAPVGPGTAGSAGAVLSAWLLSAGAGWTPRESLVATAILLLPAVWAASKVADSVGGKDPQIVVVDEVLGQWVALAGASVWNWKTVAAAFALFRVFDILKPPPARQLEKLRGGWGIVADDLMAGAYAALVLRMSGWFNFG